MYFRPLRHLLFENKVLDLALDGETDGLETVFYIHLRVEGADIISYCLLGYVNRFCDL